MQKVSASASFAVVVCILLLVGCGMPTGSNPDPSPESTETGSPASPGPVVSAIVPPTATAFPTPVPAPLPNREELAQLYAAEIQPLAETLLSAGKDPAISISPASDVVNQMLEQQGVSLQRVNPAYVEIVLMETLNQDGLASAGDDGTIRLWGMGE